jgi:hypothetical protein
MENSGIEPETSGFQGQMLLLNVSSNLERVWGIEPQLHSLEGWRHTLCIPAFHYAALRSRTNFNLSAA